MGQFSWLYSDTGRQMVDGKRQDSYLLVPKRFQEKYGESILEKCYDGYGRMGGYDIYDLVAEWNREFIPEMLELIKKGTWKCGHFAHEDDLLHYYNTGECVEGLELRTIGINMACYDEDNERLPYPIKIVERPIPYDCAGPSESDPNQGWEVDDEEVNWWEEEIEDYEDDDLDYYIDLLRELELDDTEYDYYAEQMHDLYYDDKISAKNGGSSYNSLAKIYEDAKRTAQNNH